MTREKLGLTGQILIILTNTQTGKKRIIEGNNIVTNGGDKYYAQMACGETPDDDFDAAHHGPSAGIREWTQGNQLRYYARSAVLHDLTRGLLPPAAIFRAHFHRYWPETVHTRINLWLLAALAAFEQARAGTLPPETLSAILQLPDTTHVHQFEIILLPGYVGMNEYGRQASGSTPTISIGLIATEIIDGRLQRPHHAFEREIDLRRTETL
jgi:hypothetical protein